MDGRRLFSASARGGKGLFHRPKHIKRRISKTKWGGMKSHNRQFYQNMSRGNLLALFYEIRRCLEIGRGEGDTCALLLHANQQPPPLFLHDGGAGGISQAGAGRGDAFRARTGLGLAVLFLARGRGGGGGIAPSPALRLGGRREKEGALVEGGCFLGEIGWEEERGEGRLMPPTRKRLRFVRLLTAKEDKANAAQGWVGRREGLEDTA